MHCWVGPYIVKGLPKVLVLNVENNGITDKGVDAIVKYLPNLLSLNASCNCITDIGADKIKYFKELE
ncbi:hypothetical protein [Candidatus Tisiphia endosymbiont of Parasteatoda lunata]|uniref:hypothetical protein n=1 Tax=Candidatus Tisiphia endosymbiont of Parasteatoda lunata TaxID=3066275 RepID=UPI0039773E43